MGQVPLDSTFSAHEMFGGVHAPGIVAIERAGERAVRLYIRANGHVVSTTEQLAPWIVTGRDSLNAPALRGDAEWLAGEEPLRARVRFDSWSAWMEAYRAVRDAGFPHIAQPSAAEQYLIDSGKGLFRGMEFSTLVRAQLDIESLGIDPTADDARIILVTLSVNGKQAVVLRGDELDEPELLDAIAQWIAEVDPDVIEGHNLFNFDLPFLAERARRYRRALLWGRDGSPVRFGNEQRFKAGPRSVPYRAAHVYGRHFIDTYQQIQRYDSAGQLESYALKPAVEALGLTREDRVFVSGGEIARLWGADRERLVRYVLDDVYDVNTISELALPTEFYQSQILPRTLQSCAVGGPGEKVNDLLVRVYLARGQSVPLPSPPRDYPGGYADVLRAGSFGPVVKCDVESLYPAIMLTDRIAPRSDHLGVFLPMLSILTERRLLAKRAEQESSGAARALWRGIQSSFKVLINSFYGYLGYSRGYLNDYAAAEAVTLRGQALVQQVVRELEGQGAMAIEVDTDGVYFQPPAHTRALSDEIHMIERVNATLPPGIRLAHDGRYKGMLSLKLKNYALLDYDGRVILKGSSLRSRREEPVLRRFVRDAVPRFLDPDAHGALRDFYLDLAQAILEGTLPVEDICRTETVTDQTFSSESNRRLAEALGGEERVGERVLVYQRDDGSLARIDEYAGDEDRQHLLRRLREMAERFRPLFDTDTDFDFTFPRTTIRSDIAALRAGRPVRQLGLFTMSPQHSSNT